MDENPWQTPLNKKGEGGRNKEQESMETKKHLQNCNISIVGEGEAIAMLKHQSQIRQLTLKWLA
jgi:hypothetical protein